MEIKIEVEEETNNGIKRKYDQCSNEAYTHENRKEDLELMAKTDDEINEFIAREKNMRNVFDRLPDGGKKLIETLHRCKAELQRRNKVRSQQMGNEADRSHGYRTETQNLVASNVEAPLAKRLSPRTTMKVPIQYAPWTDPKSTPCDPLTDEKMQRIVDELVRLGVSEFDVGKAAEVCYNDPVKVKVLFALPSHMRKSYVCGFLHPPS